MVTGYPQLLVAPPTTGSTRAALDTTRRAETGRLQTRPGILGRMVRRVGQFICGFSGHDRILKYEQNRVALVCASCGHVSPGWELTAPMPQLRFAGDPKRHQLRPGPARVTSRRVA